VPIPRKVRPVVIGFFAVLMGLIMAIACLNVATMLLARSANRRKEVAIRLGTGASRFRLIRQMISEGILLSLLGGVAGFGLTYGLSVLNSQLPQPAAAPLQPNLAVDWHAAIFAFAVAIVCGIAFSLAPGLQATNTDIAPALKEGAALQLAGYRRFGLRNLAMGTQVAGSLMLLLITGFLVIGITSESNIETKFDPKTMVLLSIDPVRDGYSEEKSAALFNKVIERLKTGGTSRSFALAAQPPFSSVDEDETDQLTVEDSRASSAVRKPAAKETVGAGYFGALSEPMLAGRDFEESDQRIQTAGSKGAVLPVILNESAARGFFGISNAVGKRLRDGAQSYDVVGVARDFKGESWISQSTVYLPLTRRDFARPPAGGITILVRSNAATNALSQIRNDIASLAPNLTIFNEGTLSEYLERSRYITRSAVRTYGGMGLFGLLLSAIGLAGVTAYAVAQRHREIGIRMALGARQGQVLRLVLREGTALVTIGTVLGFIGAIAISRILSALTSDFADAFKTGTNDPRLLVGAPLLLIAIAIVACYLPARRATKVDPLTALRQE
jgi:predicted permease